MPINTGYRPFILFHIVPVLLQHLLDLPFRTPIDIRLKPQHSPRHYTPCHPRGYAICDLQGTGGAEVGEKGICDSAADNERWHESYGILIGL